MWATKIAIGVGVCFFLSFGAADVDFGSQMAVIDEEIVANLTSTASFNASESKASSEKMSCLTPR